MKTMIFLSFIFFVAAGAHAQRGIRLTSRLSGRQKFIPEGVRVIYQYSNAKRPAFVGYGRYGQPFYHGTVGRGVLKILNDSTIQVDQETIQTKDLMTFGQYYRGRRILGGVLAGGGLIVLIAGASQAGESNGSSTVTAAGVAAAMEVGAVIATTSNLQKSMSAWRVEVVGLKASH